MGPSGLEKQSKSYRVALLIVAMLLFAGLVYFFGRWQPALIAFFFVPTVLAACWYGRKGGIVVGLSAVVLVALVMILHHAFLASAAAAVPGGGQHRWMDLAIWGVILLLTGHMAGRLFERGQAEMRELRETYWGFLPVLNMFVNKDEYSQSHTLRVAVYAAKIAAAMGLAEVRVEDVHAAALVRDLAKVKISREALAKAAKLSPEALGSAPAASGVGGSLRRVLPIILAEPAKNEGGEGSASSRELPLETRILAVADVYASLTADRPYRKAMSAEDARDVIIRGAGNEFDREVVNAFERAFARREMEVSPGSV